MTCRRAINHTPESIPEAAPLPDPVVVGGYLLGDDLARTTLRWDFLSRCARGVERTSRRVVRAHAAQIAKPTGEITRN